MRTTSTTRRTVRLLAAGMALTLAGLVSGCSSFSTPSWDPSDLMDFLDTKKRTPGERKPVFPEGVPGITQGVPKELVRGSPEHQAAIEAQAAASAPPVEQAPAPAPQAEPARPQRSSKSAARRSPAPAQHAAQGQVEIAPDDVNVEEESSPPLPSQPVRRQARTRTTAPPPEQPQQQANPFPAPLPR